MAEHQLIHPQRGQAARGEGLEAEAQQDLVTLHQLLHHKEIQVVVVIQAGRMGLEAVAEVPHLRAQVLGLHQEGQEVMVLEQRLQQALAMEHQAQVLH